MIAAGFELPLDVLRARQNVKWAKYGPDVLPAWVAEMDFGVAYPISRVLRRAAEDQEFGYPQREGGGGGEALARAFRDRMQARFGWQTDPALVQPVTDLVQGTFACLTAFSDRGDGVVLQLPAYPPFHEAINSTGRRLLPWNLHSLQNGHAHESGALENAIDASTKVLLLCHPQNPTGRVLPRAELEAIGRLAIERDLIIVSDEIHADLIHPGHGHIPMGAISPEIGARTVTLTSATKGFNIPGLRCGVLYFGSAALRERFLARIPARLLGGPGITGIDATIAAWDHGQPWLDGVLPVLDRNRRRIASFLRAELPEIGFHMPEATYLGWLDCTRLELPVSAFDFFHGRAKVALSPGQAFNPGAEAFARLNFATSPAILDQILARMADAVRHR